MPKVIQPKVTQTVVKATEKIMDVSRMSDDDIQDMFAEVYEKQVAQQNGFDSYECIAKRENTNKNISMEVTVIGMAGSPTIDDYKAGKVKNAQAVTISREGKGTLKFALSQKDIHSLNTNDYLVIYRVR